MNRSTYQLYEEMIDNNSMYPEDWEDLIFSDMEDFEVVSLIMLGRFYNKHRND